MKKLLITIIGLSSIAFSCEDFVTQEPVDQILTENTIIDAASADQAILGIYSRMQTANLYGDASIGYVGILSDELQHSGSFPSIAEMDQNDVTAANVSLDNIWQQAYTTIFQCNNVIEILEVTDFPDLTAEAKSVHIGEARFVRAFLHHHLAALYGAIPLVTTTDVAVNSEIARTSQGNVYDFVITEAAAAATELATADWGANAQYRATEWAAKALRARALLYNGDASAAATVADDVITNGGYSLGGSYSGIFTPGYRNPETGGPIIFSMFYSATDGSGLAFQFLQDGGRFEYAVGDELVSAMLGDLTITSDDDPRALISLNGSDPQGRYVVEKYTDVNTGTDNTVLFRLAEMHLIRAEGNSATAAADINALRTRAGAPAYSGSGSLADVLAERFVELSFEGHRWFDLVRTGNAQSVMGSVAGSNFTANDELMPIPQREIQQNPNLTQNPGY
ncbi:RagB/SusD family nutrient uptake outer membrane protein [Ekhidna sp. To15]|uniref:RagB/SusD family nutrient uptake outer membrane protein n=1 Tax=Ekhidna sp. To15 TaxID=3395267 RepID=UPI003F51D11A